MPLDNYYTKPDYSRQLKQYSGTSAIFSGTTNILQAFYVKSIEIDTAGAVLSDALLFDGIKFRPGQPGGFSGNVITNGFNLSYISGLTYYVSPGTYRYNNTIVPFTGQYFDIISGQSGGSRFDLVYISAGSTTISVRTGTTTTNPTVPNLQLGELEVGVILVPVGFTGGTGGTIIQTTAATVFEYFNSGAGNGIQRTAVGANTQAPGSFSFAVGRDSDAYAPDSVTLGVDTKASGNSQTVVGTFNIPTTTDYFIVGHGTDDSNRANAFNITNAGDTYANRKLFVTNVEIETTGATNGQVLKFNGTKYTPQFETITGLTFFTGGTSLISSITSNSLLVKALTGSTGITITESNGLITIGLNFSGTNAVTDIVSLTGGTSIISGKTGTTFFLYPIQGSGGTSVTLVDGKLIVYSDSSGSTTGQNIGIGSEVFAGKSVNELQFRRLSSVTPTNLTIQQVGDTIIFSATSSAVTTVALYEDVTYPQLTDKITGSTLQIGKQYRIISGRINEGAGTFGYVVVNAIDINKISKNGTLIALNPDYYGAGNYDDVLSFTSNANIAYSGQTLFTNQVSIYNNNHYRVTTNTTFNNTLTNLALLARDFVNDYGYITTNDYIEYDFTSDTITKRIDSFGNTVEGKSAIDVFPWGRKNQVLNNRVINNSVAEIMNFRGIISGNTFDNNARLVSSFDDTNFILDNTNIRNNVLISAATFTNTQFRNCDISTDFGLVNRTLANYNFVSKLVTSDVNQLETSINVPSNTLDLTNYNHFGVFNISAASASFSINAIQNYNQTYKLTFKPLAGYIFNFVHSSTIRNELEDTHPIDGNYDEIITYQKRSKAGTVFYQENINTFKALSAITTPIIGDITSVDTTGAKSLIEDVSSASTTGRTVTFRALVEGTNITIDDTSAPGYLIINSQASGVTTVTGIQPVGSGNIQILSSVTNNDLVYKTISAGTGMNITDDGNGTITFNSTATGSTSGGTLSGDYLPLSGGTVSGDTIFLNPISAYSINIYNTNNSLYNKIEADGAGYNFWNEGSTTIIFSAIDTNPGYKIGIGNTGTQGFIANSGLTTDRNYYLPDKDGTFALLSDLTGLTSGGTGSTVSGNFLPLSGGTLTGGLSATTISATSIDRLNYIDFNTGASVSQNFGRTFFNGTEQTLSYYGEGITEIKVGQQLYSRVYNNTGSLLAKGTAVKVTGATQGLPTVCAAIATDSGDNRVVGLVANNIANGSSGLVINNGLISGLTLNNFVVGDILYLSPVSAGTYVNSLTGYGFNIRTNAIGRVVATGSTTGQIYVNPQNEDATLSLTSIERNIVEGNAISTGVYEFTGLTTGSTNTTFNISPVRGWITYNTYQYATAPEVTNVYYSGGTNLTTPYLTSNTQTYILLTSAATISYQTTFPTPQQRRQNIYLGKLGHGTRTTILNVFSEPDSDISPLSQVRDMFTPIKLINDGVIASANGSNLNINTSTGILYGMGIGFSTNQLNPNSLTVNATAPATFQYRVQTGGTGGPYSSTTLIDPLFYDLNGVRTAVGTPAKQATNQRIFMLQNGQFRIQYGQTKYTDLTAAIAAVQTESFTTFQNFRDNAILIGVLSVESDTTALNNTSKARFTLTSKFGEVVGGTGGIATTTLQQAYNNASQPEILTDSTRNAVSIQNGTGNADSVTNLLEGQNTAGSVTSFIRADGTISGLTFLGDASNLTGVLSKTLLTRNIPVTSQVAQVGSFYLYDKITITSATASVTVTSITSDASISAYTPSIKFFANTGVTVTFQNSATLKTEGGLDAVISGSTYDSITFTYNNNIQKYFQTNINNYI